MGRLTEAFGFCVVDPKEFNDLWIKHNITNLTPSKELYSIRLSKLRAVRTSKKSENEKNNKSR